MKKALLTLITVGVFASASAYAGFTYVYGFGTTESDARASALAQAKSYPGVKSYGIASCGGSHMGPPWTCKAWVSY